MFPSSVIRKLARSEEIFAETHNFVGLGAYLEGPIDVDAMSEAFDLLLQAHPVLGGRIERESDGRYQIVVDDLVHPGMDVFEIDDPATEPPAMVFDQNASLVHLRLTLRDGQAQQVLYIHHSLADGHHQFSLIEELFANYTDLVSGGTAPAITVHPAPDSLEAVLADRGVQKQSRSGLERFLPAMYVYDIPQSRRAATDAKPSAPLLVPMKWCELSEQETDDVVTFCREQRVGLNRLLSAVILMAEWRIRNTPNVPVPYVYPVDLRYVLSPPVSATGCTNPVGVATYLAEIGPDTDVVDLARDIAESYRKDVAEGVIQQSLLHFSPQYVGNPPGLPDVVMFTDNGVVPTMRMPPGVKLTASFGELFFAVSAGIDMYTSKVFAGRLMIEYHSHGPAPERSIEEIHSLLRDMAAKHAAGRLS